VPDYIQTTNADANGNATLTLHQIAAGLEWVIQQVGVAVTPPTNVVVSGTIIANILRNNQLISSTNQGGRGSAGGQPYYKIGPNDSLVVTWVNAGAGSQCIATFSYSEHGAGMANANNTGIV